MPANAHAEENGSHKPSAHACRFLNARIAPFAHSRRFRTHQRSIALVQVEIVGCEGREDSIEGFQFRCSNALYLTPDCAPKLSASAVGIESERYDCDKISLVTFPKGIPLGLSRKESNAVR